MSTYQYKEGTLMIDLMDTKTNALVWRGWGWAVTILEDLNPQNVEKKLDRTIQRIFLMAFRHLLVNSPGTSS